MKKSRCSFLISLLSSDSGNLSKKLRKLHSEKGFYLRCDGKLCDFLFSWALSSPGDYPVLAIFPILSSNLFP